MIQDIAPDYLKNEYEPCDPKPGDWIFCFRGGEILVEKEAFEQKKSVIFPEYGKKSRILKENLQYIFRMRGRACFLYIDPERKMEMDHKIETEPPEGWQFIPVRSLRFVEQKSECMAGATAYHLALWYRDNRFCGRCGSSMKHGVQERMMICPRCRNMVYPKIAPAVIVAVIDPETERIVMTKYADRAYKKYALIAGFTEIGETVEQTVAREVMEEVGLSVTNISYYKSQPWGFDSNLLLGFFAELSGSDEITREEKELSVAEWMPRAELEGMDDGISLTREMMGEFYRRGKAVLEF